MTEDRALGKSGLTARVRRGEYVVDADAVAAAMLRRWRQGGSGVFVPAEALDRPAVLPDEDEPVALTTSPSQVTVAAASAAARRSAAS